MPTDTSGALHNPPEAEVTRKKSIVRGDLWPEIVSTERSPATASAPDARTDGVAKSCRFHLPVLPHSSSPDERESSITSMRQHDIENGLVDGSITVPARKYTEYTITVRDGLLARNAKGDWAPAAHSRRARSTR